MDDSDKIEFKNENDIRRNKRMTYSFNSENRANFVKVLARDDKES